MTEFSARDRETLELLAGERRGNKPGQAVRVQDLDGLNRLADRLQSVSTLTAAPTAAQFNALVRDVEALRGALYAIQQALRARL